MTLTDRQLFCDCVSMSILHRVAATLESIHREVAAAHSDHSNCDCMDAPIESWMVADSRLTVTVPSSLIAAVLRCELTRP